MGILPRNPLSPKLRVQDHRPDALRLLAQMQIVTTTAEGRPYLSEEEPERSRVKRSAKIT